LIKIAVCDDEPFMAEEIAGHISKYMEEKGLTACCVESFANGRLLLDSGCDFDLIFLDIQMQQPDGMATAKMLRQQKSRALLIFVTVLKDCVFDAFEVEAYDYLLKPVDSLRFQRTMDRAIGAIERRRSGSVIIRRGNSCQVLLLEQITYCEVQGRKIYIHRDDGTVIDHYERLEDFERRVDRRFFRCHRSYLVNLEYVRSCRDGQVTLARGDALPVSRLRERDLANALLRYMKERNS